MTQNTLYTGHTTHVSDTTRWTALYRATESARQDGLFSDPLATRLAGEQRRAIVARVPRMSLSGLVARRMYQDHRRRHCRSDCRLL